MSMTQKQLKLSSFATLEHYSGKNESVANIVGSISTYLCNVKEEQSRKLVKIENNENKEFCKNQQFMINNVEREREVTNSLSTEFAIEVFDSRKQSLLFWSGKEREKEIKTKDDNTIKSNTVYILLQKKRSIKVTALDGVPKNVGKHIIAAAKSYNFTAVFYHSNKRKSINFMLMEHDNKDVQKAKEQFTVCNTYNFSSQLRSKFEEIFTRDKNFQSMHIKLGDLDIQHFHFRYCGSADDSGCLAFIISATVIIKENGKKLVLVGEIVLERTSLSVELEPQSASPSSTFSLMPHKLYKTPSSLFASLRSSSIIHASKFTDGNAMPASKNKLRECNACQWFILPLHDEEETKIGAPFPLYSIASCTHNKYVLEWKTEIKIVHKSQTSPYTNECTLSQLIQSDLLANFTVLDNNALLEQRYEEQEEVELQQNSSYTHRELECATAQIILHVTEYQLVNDRPTRYTFGSEFFLINYEEINILRKNFAMCHDKDLNIICLTLKIPSRNALHLASYNVDDWENTKTNAHLQCRCRTLRLYYNNNKLGSINLLDKSNFANQSREQNFNSHSQRLQYHALISKMTQENLESECVISINSVSVICSSRPTGSVFTLVFMQSIHRHEQSYNMLAFEQCNGTVTEEKSKSQNEAKSSMLWKDYTKLYNAKKNKINKGTVTDKSGECIQVIIDGVDAIQWLQHTLEHVIVDVNSTPLQLYVVGANVVMLLLPSLHRAIFFFVQYVGTELRSIPWSMPVAKWMECVPNHCEVQFVLSKQLHRELILRTACELEFTRRVHYQHWFTTLKMLTNKQTREQMLEQWLRQVQHSKHVPEQVNSSWKLKDKSDILSLTALFETFTHYVMCLKSNSWCNQLLFLLHRWLAQSYHFASEEEWNIIWAYTMEISKRQQWLKLHDVMEVVIKHYYIVNYAVNLLFCISQAEEKQKGDVKKYTYTKYDLRMLVIRSLLSCCASDFCKWVLTFSVPFVKCKYAIWENDKSQGKGQSNNKFELPMQESDNNCRLQDARGKNSISEHNDFTKTNDDDDDGDDCKNNDMHNNTFDAINHINVFEQSDEQELSALATFTLNGLQERVNIVVLTRSFVNKIDNHTLSTSLDATNICNKSKHVRSASDMSGVLGTVLLASCIGVQVYVNINHSTNTDNNNNIICTTSAIPNARFVVDVTPFCFDNYDDYKEGLIWSTDLLSYYFLSHNLNTSITEIHYDEMSLQMLALALLSINITERWHCIPQLMEHVHLCGNLADVQWFTSWIRTSKCITSIFNDALLIHYIGSWLDMSAQEMLSELLTYKLAYNKTYDKWKGNSSNSVDQYIKSYPLLAVISRLVLSSSSSSSSSELTNCKNISICADNNNFCLYDEIINKSVFNLIENSLKVSKEFMLLPVLCILQQRTKELMSLFQDHMEWSAIRVKEMCLQHIHSESNAPINNFNSSMTNDNISFKHQALMLNLHNYCGNDYYKEETVRFNFSLRDDYQNSHLDNAVQVMEHLWSQLLDVLPFSMKQIAESYLYTTERSYQSQENQRDAKKSETTHLDVGSSHHDEIEETVDDHITVFSIELILCFRRYLFVAYITEQEKLVHAAINALTNVIMSLQSTKSQVLEEVHLLPICNKLYSCTSAFMTFWHSLHLHRHSHYELHSAALSRALFLFLDVLYVTVNKFSSCKVVLEFVKLTLSSIHPELEQVQQKEESLCTLLPSSLSSSQVSATLWSLHHNLCDWTETLINRCYKEDVYHNININEHCSLRKTQDNDEQECYYNEKVWLQESEDKLGQLLHKLQSEAFNYVDNENNSQTQRKEVTYHYLITKSEMHYEQAIAENYNVVKSNIDKANRLEEFECLLQIEYMPSILKLVTEYYVNRIDNFRVQYHSWRSRQVESSEIDTRIDNKEQKQWAETIGTSGEFNVLSMPLFALWSKSSTLSGVDATSNVNIELHEKVDEHVHDHSLNVPEIDNVAKGTRADEKVCNAHYTSKEERKKPLSHVEQVKLTESKAIDNVLHAVESYAITLQNNNNINSTKFDDGNNVKLSVSDAVIESKIEIDDVNKANNVNNNTKREMLTYLSESNVAWWKATDETAMMTIDEQEVESVVDSNVNGYVSVYKKLNHDEKKSDNIQQKVEFTFISSNDSCVDSSASPLSDTATSVTTNTSDLTTVSTHSSMTASIISTSTFVVHDKIPKATSMANIKWGSNDKIDLTSEEDEDIHQWMKENVEYEEKEEFDQSFSDLTTTTNTPNGHHLCKHHKEYKKCALLYEQPQERIHDNVTKKRKHCHCNTHFAPMHSSKEGKKCQKHNNVRRKYDHLEKEYTIQERRKGKIVADSLLYGPLKLLHLTRVTALPNNTLQQTPSEYFSQEPGKKAERVRAERDIGLVSCLEAACPLPTSNTNNISEIQGKDHIPHPFLLSCHSPEHTPRKVQLQTCANLLANQSEQKTSNIERNELRHLPTSVTNLKVKLQPPPLPASSVLQHPPPILLHLRAPSPPSIKQQEQQEQREKQVEAETTNNHEVFAAKSKEQIELEMSNNNRNTFVTENINKLTNVDTQNKSAEQMLLKSLPWWYTPTTLSEEEQLQAKCNLEKSAKLRENATINYTGTMQELTKEIQHNASMPKTSERQFTSSAQNVKVLNAEEMADFERYTHLLQSKEGSTDAPLHGPAFTLQQHHCKSYDDHTNNINSNIINSNNSNNINMEIEHKRALENFDEREAELLRARCKQLIDNLRSSHQTLSYTSPHHQDVHHDIDITKSHVNTPGGVNANKHIASAQSEQVYEHEIKAQEQEIAQLRIQLAALEQRINNRTQHLSSANSVNVLSTEQSNLNSKEDEDILKTKMEYEEKQFYYKNNDTKANMHKANKPIVKEHQELQTALREVALLRDELSRMSSSVRCIEIDLHHVRRSLSHHTSNLLTDMSNANNKYYQTNIDMKLSSSSSSSPITYASFPESTSPVVSEQLINALNKNRRLLNSLQVDLQRVQMQLSQIEKYVLVAPPYERFATSNQTINQEQNSNNRMNNENGSSDAVRNNIESRSKQESNTEKAEYSSVIKTSPNIRKKVNFNVAEEPVISFANEQTPKLNLQVESERHQEILNQPDIVQSNNSRRNTKSRREEDNDDDDVYLKQHLSSNKEKDISLRSLFRESKPQVAKYTKTKNRAAHNVPDLSMYSTHRQPSLQANKRQTRVRSDDKVRGDWQKVPQYSSSHNVYEELETSPSLSVSKYSFHHPANIFEARQQCRRKDSIVHRIINLQDEFM